MPLRLTRRSDYAIRACLYLARHERTVPTREIAARMRVPEPFLPRVLADLARSGLVQARTGMRGGYRLGRAPARISILDVVEAMEGPMLSRECALRNAPCSWKGTCALHDTWRSAQEALIGVLGGTTIAHVAERDDRISDSPFPPAPARAPGLTAPTP